MHRVSAAELFLSICEGVRYFLNSRVAYHPEHTVCALRGLRRGSLLCASQIDVPRPVKIICKSEIGRE
jgi:hypothetical protein